MEIAFLPMGRILLRDPSHHRLLRRKCSPPSRRGLIFKRASGTGERTSKAPHSGVPERFPKSYPSGAAELTDPSYSFLSTTAALSDWLHPVPRPSLVHYEVLWVSELPSSTGRIYGSPRDPSVFRSRVSLCWLARRVKFISTRSPKPVVQRPRDVLTSTHLRTTSSTYRCVVSFVILVPFSLFLSLLLLRCTVHHHETRFETSPLTLERRSGSKCPFWNLFRWGRTQPVVSWPRNVLTMACIVIFMLPSRDIV